MQNLVLLKMIFDFWHQKTFWELFWLKQKPKRNNPPKTAPPLRSSAARGLPLGGPARRDGGGRGDPGLRQAVRRASGEVRRVASSSEDELGCLKRMDRVPSGCFQFVRSLTILITTMQKATNRFIIPFVCYCFFLWFCWWKARFHPVFSGLRRVCRLPTPMGRPLGEALEAGEAKIQVAKALKMVDAEVAKSTVPCWTNEGPFKVKWKRWSV